MDELPRDVERKATTVTLPPRKVKGWVHELKVSLSEGEAVRYETRHDRAAGAVAFNIHRHEGKEVTYYAQETRPIIAGTFTPPKGGDFFLMWENRSEVEIPVTISVERIRSAR